MNQWKLALSLWTGFSFLPEDWFGRFAALVFDNPFKNAALSSFTSTSKRRLKNIAVKADQFVPICSMEMNSSPVSPGYWPSQWRPPANPYTENGGGGRGLEWERESEREREGGGTTALGEKWASVERKTWCAAKQRKRAGGGAGVGGKVWGMLVQVFTAGISTAALIPEPIQSWCVRASQRVGTETKAETHRQWSRQYCCLERDGQTWHSWFGSPTAVTGRARMAFALKAVDN